MHAVCSNSLNSPLSLAHKNRVPLPHQVEVAELLWSFQEEMAGDRLPLRLQQPLPLLHGKEVVQSPHPLRGEVTLDITRRPLPLWHWAL